MLVLSGAKIICALSLTETVNKSICYFVNNFIILCLLFAVCFFVVEYNNIILLLCAGMTWKPLFMLFFICDNYIVIVIVVMPICMHITICSSNIIHSGSYLISKRFVSV